MAITVISAVLLATGTARALPADFAATSKVTMLHPNAKHRTFETKLLNRPQGRVIGRCASFTGTGRPSFRVTCNFARGSVVLRGKIVPIAGDPGYLRIVGGTGAYAGASGRRYHLAPAAQSKRVFFDFTPRRARSDLPFEPYAG